MNLMTTTPQRLRIRFAPETYFEAPAVPFRATQTSDLENLKNQLLRQALAGAGPDQNVLLRRAANEAASLVWLTPYPLLLFPALFEEKAAAARQQGARQTGVRRRSLNLLLDAA